MKILRIEIKGYRRLSLNKIETIVIEPDKKFHWVLGTNGSGKSSLFKEITPLAAVPANYHKGGYKKITIEDKGKTYELLSDFSKPKNLFHFGVYENGVLVEFNPGHTSTVYNNLVFQYFGITKEIHDYCLGLRSFVSMSPSDRKTWMTRFSDADYTYALNYFKRLFSSYKDLLGSVKTDQNRIVEARSRLISPDEIKLLEEDLKGLKEKAQFLIDVCPNPSINFQQVKEKLQQLSTDLVAIKERTRKKLVEHKHLLPYGEEEDLLESQRLLESKVFSIENNSRESFQRLDEIQKQLDQQSKLQTSDVTAMQLSIIDNSSRIEELTESLEYSVIEDPLRTLEAHPNWVSTLEGLVPHLVEDVEDDLNEDNYHVNVEKLNKVSGFILQVEAKRSETFKLLEEAKNCSHDQTIECPECKHSWIPGKTPADIHRFETFLSESKIHLEKAQASKENLQEEVRRYQNFKQGLDFLNKFVWDFPEFKPFWETVFSEKLHLKNPQELGGRAFAFKKHIEACMEIKTLRDKNNECWKSIDLIKNTGVVNLSVLTKEHERLEQQIQRAYLDRDIHLDQLSKVNQKLSIIQYLKKTLEETKQKKKELDDFYLLAYEHDQRQKLSEMVISTNAEIMIKEKQLRSIEIQSAQIEMLERNLMDAQTFAKTLKVAVDELSPSTGLIAKGLTGFINHFTGLVNKLIEKVWLYPMQIIPVLPDEDNNIDLDYKFMVKIKDEEIPDISETSSGQQEIIDLAFRIVGLNFLGLDKAPLFLDEFGARMDTAHKASAFEMISRLLMTSNFSQIFMISHFEGTHCQALDADITVLCDANIQLPNGVAVNQVTKIN